ncbi:MAG: leucine-rich repeat domain-containing protein [Treponema sp.]|nr:leucine-rich repeat domain-containing protein [Treponema sp.]
MKKIRFFTACFLALLCQTFLFANTSTFNQGNFIISMNDEFTEITINGIIECNYNADVIIPDNFDGIPVTEIGRSAFSYKDMKSVSIPNSVKKIGEAAFYNCTYLKEINIPDSVTEIGHSVFYRCLELEKITIPSSVTTIGQNAFINCEALKTIKLPKNLKTIGNGAFESCSSLQNPEIPASVTTVGTGLFKGCNSVTLTYKISIARRFNTDIF